MENTGDTRVAVITIIVEDMDSVAGINSILHDANEFIIGRMGLPYKARGINIITVALDAPQNVTSEVSGKLGKLAGVTVKTTFSKM